MPTYDAFDEARRDHSILVGATLEVAALDHGARAFGRDDHGSVNADGGPMLIAEVDNESFVRRPGDIDGLMQQGD